MSGNDLQKRTFSALTGISAFVIIIQLVPCFTILADAQPEIAFTTINKFEIPSNNSSIRFATNGTYKTASLENSVWTFEELYFSYLLAPKKLTIKVSATDCDLTINPYRIFNYSSRGENVKWVIFTYTVLGHGTQKFNLGLDPKRGQLDVILNGEFIGRNHGWTRAPDGTVTITQATANVTLWYNGYPDSYKDNVNFFDGHYVVIGSTCSVAIIVVLAAFITQKRKRGETN